MWDLDTDSYSYCIWKTVANSLNEEEGKWRKLRSYTDNLLKLQKKNVKEGKDFEDFFYGPEREQTK